MRLIPYGARQLGFLTTNDCTADCPHCMLNCSPGKTEYLDFDKIKRVVDAYRERAELVVVIFTGGEPTLLKGDLLHAINYCAHLGIVTRIVTNAWWASDEAAASRMLSALRMAGLEEINFSMDDFHAPYVPIEYVRNAWKAAHGKGFGSVVIANAFHNESRITPDFIMKYFGERICVVEEDDRVCGKQIDIPASDDGTRYMISTIRLHRTGRAAESFDKDKFHEEEIGKTLRSRCSCMVESPNVTSNYHLGACCGVDCRDNAFLDLGDLSEEDLDTILRRAADNVVLNALHTLGPARVAAFICAYDPAISFEACANMCSICEKLTKDPRCVEILNTHTAELAALVLSAEKTECESCKPGNP